jgi:hypothetical protein
MSEKRERFRRFFELRSKSIDRDQLNEVSGFRNFAVFASFAVKKISGLNALNSKACLAS